MLRRANRRVLAAVGLLSLALTGVIAALALTVFSGPSPADIAAERAAARAAAAAAARAALLARETTLAARAKALVAASLPTQTGAPAPALTTSLFRTATPAHLVVGFAPYWTLSSLSPADYADTSVVAYYGLSLRRDGSLAESTPGWLDLSSAEFSGFLADARAAHDRILVTVETTDPAVITAALAHPASSAVHLANALAPLLRANRLDGVDIDIEGRDGSQRAAFVRFVQVLSARLHAAEPGIELVLDTYPQSAGDPSGFFDVKTLAPLVSQLFIMAYDMYDPTVASANAPLLSPTLGLNDTQTLLQYEQLVPAAKLVLGVPFYGYDFTTASAAPGAPSASSDPVAVNYRDIVAAAHPAHWDPASLTPYTDFVYRGRRHETWYDDPVSLALKTALAVREDIAGVGVWALGSEGDAPAMLHALDGTSPPVKLSPVAAP